VRVVYVVTAVRQAVAVESNCGFGLVSRHLIFLNNSCHWIVSRRSLRAPAPPARWDYCLSQLIVLTLDLLL
jgi:hypothetical protein